MAGAEAGGSSASGGGPAGGQTGSGGEGGASEPCGGRLSEELCAALSDFSPLEEVPPDPTNAYADDPGAAGLGQMFFFDPDFSGPLATNSDLGQAGEVFSRPWELPMPVTESPVIMNSSRLQVAHVIYDKYADDYDAVFGTEFGPLPDVIATLPATGRPSQPDWDDLDPAHKDLVTRIFVNYSKSLAAYTRLLISRSSRFDRFAAGDYELFTDSEVRGFEVFVGPGRCATCHDGTHFSDDRFHNIGVAQSGPNTPGVDNGRIGDLPGLLSSTLNASGAFSDDPEFGASLLEGLDASNEAQRGVFRTPSLRGVAETAPYMHAGQLATLEDVVEFYDRGGDTPSAGTKSPAIVPLGLTPAQKADLVAFLKSLTGEPVPPDLLEDTSY
ncbi:MAG: hypothetical protein B6A08_02775 [Sorangiineae bacterium NIC37A_2]|nr:MAG: hypothetical protein B6A08_02775 [Sorangiineae bacterium NIC37A_2]